MSNKRYLRYLPVAIGVGLVIVLAIGLYLIRDVFQKPVSTKKQVQQITVLQPPPPPPPPPPVQKPPEPEVKEEKIEEPEEPEPEPEQAEEPPPGDNLGVDSEGGAGSDSFGLVGKKGGHGLIGGGGNAIVYYGQQLQRQISDALQRGLNDKVRSQKFSAVASLWIGADGRVSRAELSGSSGRSDVDDALKGVLSGLRLAFKAPPENMPQPVKIRIRS
jgi:protein TonB